MKEFWLYFLLLALSSMAVFYIQSTILMDEDYYYAVYSEKFSVSQIDRIIEVQSRWGWAVGLLIPIFALVKLMLVSSCLLAGLFVINKQADYSSLLLASVKTEFILLILPVSAILWFLFFHSEYDPSELTNFSPFSILTFLEQDAVEPWLKYVIGSFNLLELLYLAGLAYNLRTLFAGKFTAALKVVAMSYGIGFTIWILFVGFIIINVTPQ